MFRPGEGTTKGWFARFIGPKQLAKVPINNPGGSAIVEDHSSEKSSVVIENVDEIAQAFLKALGGVTLQAGSALVQRKDEFDDVGSQERLADAMSSVTKREESNFEDLGEVKRVRKDSKTVDDTRKMLEELD